MHHTRKLESLAIALYSAHQHIVILFFLPISAINAVVLILTSHLELVARANMKVEQVRLLALFQEHEVLVHVVVPKCQS